VGIRVEQGFSLNYSWLALKNAVEKNNLEEIRLLFSQKAATPSDLAFGLLIAAQFGYATAVEMLIEAGAEVNYMFGLGTALTEAIFEVAEDVVLILIKAGADVTLPELTNNYSPLILAAGKGNLNIVTYLISAGADVNEVREETFPLLQAAVYGCENIFNYLAPLTDPGLRPEAEKALPQGIRERQREENVAPKVQELSSAVHEDDLDKVKELLNQGVNVNAINIYGSTALLVALFSGGVNNIPIIRVLLKAGANPNLGDEDYLACDIQTPKPLGVAQNMGNLEIIKLLLMRGADPNCGGLLESPPLYDAVGMVQVDIVKTLIWAGAIVDLLNEGGYTPLT